MNKRKFKIGELYRVGLDGFDNRVTETGNVIRIKAIEYIDNKKMVRYQTIKPNGGDSMFYIYSSFANCLKKISSDIDREIQITFHDKTTVAKMKEYGKVVRVGTSKCCSDDTYSAYIGALLALARIYFPNASCDNKEIRFFDTKINPKEKSEYRCDKQFSHSDINKAIYNLISRYDIAATWVAESLNNFGTALHEELDNMNTK
ncbi:MAG: hypothetical protein U0K34_12950 [Ruminococcus sp.]|nr:hypothetical protein [Ruminococcus sp.]